MSLDEIAFPACLPYHVAFVTRELEAGMAAFGRIHGDPAFTVYRQAQIETPRGMAVLDFAVADLNGFRVEVIEPAGGCDEIYREALPEHAGETRFHHVASLVRSWQDWLQVKATIARHGLATPIRGRAETPEGIFHYAYVDLRRQLGHYLEFVCITDQPGNAP